MLAILDTKVMEGEYEMIKNNMQPVVPNMKYHADDWNIITKAEKENERIEGLRILQSALFSGRCVEHYIISGDALLLQKNAINIVLGGRWFFVVIVGAHKRRQIVLIRTVDELFAKVEKIEDEDSVTFINMIQKTNDCCSGVVFSSGDGDLSIEIIPDTVNTRDLTDGGGDSNNIISLTTDIYSLRVQHGANNPYRKTKAYRFVVTEVTRACYKNRGYYEFIYGANQTFNFSNLYYTYYSVNNRYGLSKNEAWREYTK